MILTTGTYIYIPADSKFKHSYTALSLNIQVGGERENVECSYRVLLLLFYEFVLRNYIKLNVQSTHFVKFNSSVLPLFVLFDCMLIGI